MGDWVLRALAAVEAASQEQGNLSGNGVDSLRAAIMRDGRVDAGEALRLLSLHRSNAPVVREAGWADLFVEALADHFALSRESLTGAKRTFARTGRRRSPGPQMRWLSAS